MTFVCGFLSQMVINRWCSVCFTTALLLPFEPVDAKGGAAAVAWIILKTLKFNSCLNQGAPQRRSDALGTGETPDIWFHVRERDSSVMSYSLRLDLQRVVCYSPHSANPDWRRR